MSIKNSHYTGKKGDKIYFTMPLKPTITHSTPRKKKKEKNTA
jgi:hypothetical protein